MTSSVRARVGGAGVPEHLRRLDQAEVVLAAGRTALEVCGEARMRLRCLTAGELLLDVAVEHLEPGRTAGVDGLRAEHRVEVWFVVHSVAPEVTYGGS
jgi:hypothetical protein